jgi:hypothetical protein
MALDRAPSVCRPTVAGVALASLLAPLLPGTRAGATPGDGRSRAGRSAPRARRLPAEAGEVRVLALPTGLRPGGVAVRGGTLFATCLADGRILALDLRTGVPRTLLTGGRGRSLRGVQVDPRSGLLYVTGSHGRSGIVLAVDHRSGVVVRRWDVPDAGMLADLVVTPAAVWVTDARVDRLLRIPLRGDGRPMAGGSAQLVLDAPWPGGGRTLRGPDRGGRRAHGIRALPDGTLLLAHSSAGGLWSVQPADGEVRPVPVTGGPRVSAGGGIELHCDRVWVAGGSSRNGVAELRLDDHHGRLTARWVRELTDRRLRTPFTAARSGGRLWAAAGPSAPASASASWVAGLPLGRH